MLRDVFNHSDWDDRLLSCSDSIGVGVALVACSRVMLPFWDAHCVADDGFGKTVSAMTEWVACPDDESRTAVAECLNAIAVIKFPDGYRHLSMVHDEHWPPPKPVVRRAPGEYAGDSIISAANYICELDQPDAWQCSATCIESARTAMSHAFGERVHEDSEADINAIASQKLRRDLLNQLDLLTVESA